MSKMLNMWEEIFEIESSAPDFHGFAMEHSNREIPRYPGREELPLWSFQRIGKAKRNSTGASNYLAEKFPLNDEPMISGRPDYSCSPFFAQARSNRVPLPRI